MEFMRSGSWVVGKGKITRMKQRKKLPDQSDVQVSVGSDKNFETFNFY